MDVLRGLAALQQAVDEVRRGAVEAEAPVRGHLVADVSVPRITITAGMSSISPVQRVTQMMPRLPWISKNSSAR